MLNRIATVLRAIAEDRANFFLLNIQNATGRAMIPRPVWMLPKIRLLFNFEKSKPVDVNWSMVKWHKSENQERLGWTLRS